MRGWPGRYSLTIAVCYWACTGVACTSSAPPGLAMPGFEVEIGIDQQLPTLPVEIGGRTYPLMLDLGDGRRITLSPAVMAEVQPRFTGRTLRSVDAMGNPLVTREIELAELRLGARTLRGVVGFEDLEDPSYPSPNPYGAVGRNFFGDDAALLVDFPRQRLTVFDRRQAETFQANLTCIPFEPADFGIVSEVQTDRGPLTVLWDTGAQYSMIRDVQAVPGSQPRMEQRVLHFGDQVYSLELAAFAFAEPPVDAYIGYNFFNAHAVYFNLGQRCLAIDPSP